MIAAVIRTILAQPRPEMVHDQLNVITGMLGRQPPKVETMPHDAAFTSFPPSHRKQIWSTNPLERLNKEEQTPHRPQALLRLAGAVLVEATTNGKPPTAATCSKPP